MPMHHFTERNLVRLLATWSRRTDTSPWQLSRSHVDLGRFLAGELLDQLPMEHCDIPHPQGVRQGWRVEGEEQIVLIAFMRAGLYVAEGVREVLRFAQLVHASPKRGVGLSEGELERLPPVQNGTVMLIDAVVNTGASLEPVLGQLSARGARRIFVLSLVAPTSTAERLNTEYPDVDFLFARVSDNQYVGKGSTDTGNRLFGTFAEKNR